MAKSKKPEITLDDFKYVDFHQIKKAGEKGKQWERIELSQVDEYRTAHGNFNVFTTIQRFKNPKNQEDDLAYAPLFFDIDSDRMLVMDYAKEPAKAGLLEEGFIRASELSPLLPKEMAAHLSNFDMGIDLPKEICEAINAEVETSADLKYFKWLKNLEASRQDIVKIITFFADKFGLTEDETRVYFSGSKGFHLLVNPMVLDVKPMHKGKLAAVYKYVALYLKTQLSLKSLDTVVYSARRQLRLVDSTHHKSQRHKIELTPEQLKGDLRKVIDELSLQPQGDIYPADKVEYSVNEAAAKWFQAQLEVWQDTEKLATNKITLKDEVLALMEDTPVCVQFILERGILKNGDRNKATMALASYYKDKGTPMNECIDILTEWVKKIPKSMTSSNPSEARSSTITCIHTVYHNEAYHFGCAFIRSLHGEREGRNNYEVVPCAGRVCPAHEEHDEMNVPAEHMPLARTASADLTGKKVAFDALVSGKMDTPYIVPKKVRYLCHFVDGCDKSCVMKDHDGLYEREFHENERFLIEACNQNDAQTKGILFTHSHASCKKVHSEVLETENVTELLVVPMADRVNTVKNQADGSVKEVDEHGNEYVSRKIYAVGKPDHIPQANNHYRVEGYVYSHPRNAMATLLTQKHEPKEDSISRFTMTDEIKEQFKVFQVAPGETLDDRVDLMVNDLSDSITLVDERFEPHLATLMTYHSCLHYYFQGQLEKRGWMEAVFVGDSGQAKTQLVNNIMEFAGLGNITSGEGASRTGLVYRLEQLGERWFITWGKYPLSDRKLLAIDEFNELPVDDFGKITEARTTGVLKVDRTVNTETNARVRLMLMTNPNNGRTLSSYTHGVESLKPLFSSPADIRRLDIAVFLQTGDVGREVLNRERKQTDPKVITSEALHNSILWAWSRTADQIQITDQAMKRILKRATELAEKYGYAQDIPLMEPSDLRKKLARMAIALAALVHSTDDTHERVVVHPDHVDYVVDFISVVYDNKNARLDIYSAKSKEESELTEEERKEVKKALETLDFTDSAPVSSEIIELFRKNDILKPNEIIEMLGYDRGQVTTRLAILTKHSMIKRTREGLRKLPKFIEFLNG